MLLRYLDIVAKEYASALEMVFVAFLAWYYFGSPISGYLVMGMVVVIFSQAMYNREEVQSKPPPKQT